MVAQIMFFALGFLIATLLALALLPAFNARAKRLAKRRVEALLPVSLDEVRAERDLIRAEGALVENRKDQVIAKRDEALHKAMLDISEKNNRLETLQTALAKLERELAMLRTHNAELESKAASHPNSEALAAENARLSKRIEELANMLMATTSSSS